MKLVLATSAAVPAAAVVKGTGYPALLKKHAQLAAVSVREDPPPGVHYGDSRCPCIGFDNLQGETMVQLWHDGKMKDVSFPADLGARCEAWDADTAPACRDGEEAGYCSQKWCYVDPCKCDIDVLPKVSVYNSEATYRGKPIFFSYATCGGKDMFTKKVPQLGNPKCRCIGFAGVSGTTEITFENAGGDRDSKGEYPADFGATCSAWDSNRHPECEGDKPPSWCEANWCYVDPCECDLPDDLVPKISAYLPDATFTGKNLYYSYETCGSKDTWTTKYNVNACVNQQSESECGQHTRCAWDGNRCLGMELVSHPLCKAAKKEFVNKFFQSEAVSQRVFWPVMLLTALLTSTVYGA